MKAYQVVPGIIGGLAAFAVLKYGNDNPAAMAGIGFAIAFGLCCHHAKAITLRGVIAGVITIPASMAAMAMLNMDLSPAPGQGWIESGWVGFILIFWIFAAASYHVGKKCKPKEIGEAEASLPHARGGVS